MEEMLAIALEGRDRTYFIGERTTGRTDALSNTSLSDGAVLSVESWRVLDRRGSAYSDMSTPICASKTHPRELLLLRIQPSLLPRSGSTARSELLQREWTSNPVVCRRLATASRAGHLSWRSNVPESQLFGKSRSLRP